MYPLASIFILAISAFIAAFPVVQADEFESKMIATENLSYISWDESENENRFYPITDLYTPGPYVSDDVWNQVQGYLLPENHPIKPALDQIFTKYRAVESPKAMKKAGFKNSKPGKSDVVVSKHSKLKGYLIKTFLDSKDVPEWILWKQRIDGAKTIKKSIIEHNYQKFFKVPQKWIYPLPAKPDTSGPFRKDFILVVEDMNLVNSSANASYFKEKITPKILDALYVLLTENKLIDSIYIDNIPFSKDGKISFVDTEHVNVDNHPLKLHRLTGRLSSEMQAYWNKLISQGRPG